MIDIKQREVFKRKAKKIEKIFLVTKKKKSISSYF